MSSERQKLLISVLTNTVESGRFGKGSKFLRLDKDNDKNIGEQFASSIVFVTAVISGDSGGGKEKERSFKLVLKFVPANLKVREIMNSTAQFHNENNMFSEILPCLDYNETITALFPQFYYGESSNEEGKEPIIVLEDLRSKNYSPSKLKLFLDYDHIVIALQALGKFHALSYIAKQQKPNEFNKVKEKLVEHAWTQKDSTFNISAIIGPTALRGVRALSDIQSNSLLEKLTKKLEDDAEGLMKYFINPEEPTAVICHGDFCNHNMLFSYEDSSSNKPTSVKFIDLQTSRYASPVIDLSMLLFLNTEHELRSLHWDEFLTTYHNSVTTAVTAAGCTPPSFEQLLDDFRHKSFYGYFHCSYFLPMMVSEVRPDVEQLVELNPLELMQSVLQIGGDKGTELLVLILLHLQELNYFSFLEK